MDDVYNKINDCNPGRKPKIVVVFEDTIADIITNERFQAIVNDLFFRCRKLIYLLYLSRNLLFLFQ